MSPHNTLGVHIIQAYGDQSEIDTCVLETNMTGANRNETGAIKSWKRPGCFKIFLNTRNHITLLISSTNQQSNSNVLKNASLGSEQNPRY